MSKDSCFKESCIKPKSSVLMDFDIVKKHVGGVPFILDEMAKDLYF